MLLISNDVLKIYGESKLQEYSEDLLARFSQKMVKIANILYQDLLFLRIDVYLFLDNEKYNEYLTEKDDNWLIEPYKKAAFGVEKFDTIAILCDEEKLINKPFHYANVFAHMFSHYVYRGDAFHLDGTLWFDEGLAQILSGERNRLEDEELFKQTLITKVFDEKWKIPMIENLYEHGHEPDKFDSDDYNGYTISYMLVRYLRDRAPKGKYFKNVWLSFTGREEDIINRAYNYYGTLFKIPGYKADFSNVRTPDDLYDFMELALTHGWVDINGERHEHTLEGIKDLYRINSLEQVLESGLATCIEQTMLEHYVFNNLGIENKIFVNKELILCSHGNKVRLHCFCAYKEKDMWIYFEHANKDKKGIYYFSNLHELLDYQYKKMPVDRFITEIPEIPVGYTIQEFYNYIDSFKRLGRGR